MFISGSTGPLVTRNGLDVMVTMAIGIVLVFRQGFRTAVPACEQSYGYEYGIAINFLYCWYVYPLMDTVR